MSGTADLARNAYPKIGGVVNGEVHADRLWSKTSLNLGEGIWGERHGISLTGKDNASFEENNLEIRSWFGIGFYSALTEQTSIFFDTRKGDIATRGAITTNGLITPRVEMIGGGRMSAGPDNASFEGNNLEISSWFGIGFKSTYNNPQGHSTVFVNTRNGDIATRGTIRMGNGTVMALGQNCWRDNNGFIKTSSPIIQIHPDGKFTTNDESEGATVTKLGTGHYQVSGVLGYNADGAWGVHGGISSPKNNNGLELIYIDDKVHKDGSITIETFHRQHAHLPERFQNKRFKSIVDGEAVYYADGEPCDIPEGCRLDVHVQMPTDSVWNQKQASSEEE
ncbi:hypothetical protein ID856_17315 [Xenorhabdus sp. 18]|uniref:phage tail fiber protein n=1 Tax=Xenorhabdus doucetiae TaxID=351671 RepID=UPI00199EDF5A|nr:tail fiber protein [Xenorhabdus sp. 18]MBD2798262.1 hypothetical protein [Xenorhabdus sp. 18]